MSGGVTSTLIGNGMTRAPVVRFPSAKQASEVKVWLEDEDNFKLVKESFRGSSRYFSSCATHKKTLHSQITVPI